MHNRGFCHRDLKVTNMLINSEGVVKIIDFGFACEAKGKLNMYCGTRSYMPPELVNKFQYYGKPMDIWACGVVLYKLLVGDYPFGGKLVFFVYFSRNFFFFEEELINFFS